MGKKIRVSPDGKIIIGEKISSDDGNIRVENGIIIKGKKITISEQ
jgi:hypothetical protein